MKKVLSLILAVCVAWCALSLTAAAAEKDRAATDAFYAKKLVYDIDGDGDVTMDDVRTALCAAAGVIDEPEDNSFDVDGDSDTTTLDALAILRIKCGIDKFYTDTDVLNYLTSELNWVKTTRPGFTRKTEEKCTSVKVTSSGAPVSSFNVNDMEYDDFIEKNKVWIVLGSGEDGYEEMLAQAKSIYEPQITEKTIAKGDSKHYTYFPLNGKSVSCKFDENSEYKSIALKENSNGTVTITLTMKNYSYPNSTYPYKNLTSIPYGQAFNLPALSGVEKMDLNSGKIVCVIDTVTGGINTVDYSYTYIAQASGGDTVEGYDFTMSEKMTVKYSEHFDIDPVAA